MSVKISPVWLFLFLIKFERVKVFSYKIILEALYNNKELAKTVADKSRISFEVLWDYLQEQCSTDSIIFVDGGARGNPGDSGAGIVFITKDGRKDGYYYYLGNSTNNYAEYTALLYGLRLTKEKQIDSLKIFADSELVVKQIKGEYKVKNKILFEIYVKCMEILNSLKQYTISHIPREENKEADALVNKAIDLQKSGRIDLTVAE